MKGLVINGFTVVEALGSGQGGILYLARDSEGREAVIRVARDGEDNVAIRIFIEEAKQLLPSATDVETTVAADGRRILMARATPVPGTRTPPPALAPQGAAGSPGMGFTRYAATERLPEPGPPPAPASPSRLSVLLLLAALVVFGAGVSMIVLALRAAPRPPTLPAVVQPTGLDAGLPVPDAGALVLMAIAHDAGALAAAPAEPHAAPPPEAARPSSKTVTCSPIYEWQAAMTKKLIALSERTAMEPQQYRAQASALSSEIDAATTPAECVRLTRAFRDLERRALQADEPGVASCKPTPEWKRLMFGNLEALEGHADAIPMVEVLRESYRIGKLVHEANDEKSCRKAVREYESVHKRAFRPAP
jgi:hypothetical protein